MLALFVVVVVVVVLLVLLVDDMMVMMMMLVMGKEALGISVMWCVHKEDRDDAVRGWLNTAVSSSCISDRALAWVVEA